MSDLVLRLKVAHWDPHKHPRDGEGQFSHIPGSGVGKTHLPPLSDAEYADRVNWLQGKLTRAFKAGRATSRTQTVHGAAGWGYRPERARQHRQIVDDLMAKYAHVPNEGKGVISGGLGGAGKTTVLGKFSDIDPSKYATINADDVKDLMAERGMVPTADGVSPLEAASLIHDESRHITQMFADRLFAERKNAIWDTTMNGESIVYDILGDMRAHGYRDVRAVFVDIPVETSVQRALARHRRGLEDYRNGEGFGGRFVPPHIIRASESRNYKGSSHNRTVFERTKGKFNGWELWDNSVDGRDPQLVASSKGGKS